MKMKMRTDGQDRPTVRQADVWDVTDRQKQWKEKEDRWTWQTDWQTGRHVTDRLTDSVFRLSVYTQDNVPLHNIHAGQLHISPFGFRVHGVFFRQFFNVDSFRYHSTRRFSITLCQYSDINVECSAIVAFDWMFVSNATMVEHSTLINVLNYVFFRKWKEKGWLMRKRKALVA